MQYPTYDGIIFQWFMCSGILMVGLVWGLLSNNWAQFAEEGLYTFPQGVLGGALFAVANLLIPTVVNTLGLGVGFMLWNATNIGMGYAISRFGLFGVVPTVPSSPALSAVGIAFMLGSIVVYGLIEPTLAGPQQRLPRSDELSPLVAGSRGPGLLPTTTTTATATASATGKAALPRTASTESLPSALLHPELPNYGPFTMPPAAAGEQHVALADAGAEKQRKAIGTLIALLVGAFLSCCLVPFAHWQQTCTPSGSATRVLATCDPLSFVFSQCLGIYVASTLAFLLYSLLHRFVLRRSMPRSVMRPAYACGVLWALGLGGQLYAAGQLGFDQAYPVTSIGPAMVSMLWSACYFREIQGARNLAILAVATAMVLVGTALRVVSA
ncbi:hypothetical protein PybrP1_012835 [[Pythium] brassicae (nom. inval.)]|nr:hypothetical protein PybrP1_012835 [[Pythium] brassicae (nom. inval.)]